MTTPSQFNFSYWKPNPKIEIFNDQFSGRDTFTQIRNPNYGTGDYTDLNPYVVSELTSWISYSAGNGGDNSIQFFSTSNMGMANVTIYGSTNRMGIAFAESISALQNFIYSKNTSDLEFLGTYGFDYSTGVSYAQDLDYNYNENKSVSLNVQDSYFIVYAIDTINQPPAMYWANYSLEHDGNTGLQYLPTPFYSSDTQFIFTNPSSRPTELYYYFDFTFNYQPFLKVDKTIENSLGTSLTISSINVEIYFLDEKGNYNYHYTYSTNTVVKEYDNITDTYIIYPNTPFTIYNIRFEAALFVITYTTNAGEIVKHQTALSYSNPPTNYVYPNAYVYANSSFTFYLPLYNETIKSIDEYASGINVTSYNGLTGYITAKAATYVKMDGTLPITYTTSKNVTRVLHLRFPSGNSVISCGNTAKNVGYSSNVYYDVALGAGIGMVELSFQNFHIADRVAMEIPIGTTKFDTNRVVGGGFRAYVDKTSPLAQTARIRVTSSYGSQNYWKVVTSCVRNYVSYTTNQTFQFDNGFTKNDIASLSPTLNVYVPAISGIDYIFDSIISPTMTSYKALKNLRVFTDNNRVVAVIDKKYMYSDPFTSTPIYHGVIRLEYPNKTVIGNDLNHPNDGDIKISRMDLDGTYQYFVVNNPQDLISNCSVYRPKCFVPAVTGYHPITIIGVVEYIKDSNSYRHPLSIRDVGTHNITMLDSLGDCFTGGPDNVSQSKVSVDYRGMMRLSGLPITQPTSGWGQYWNVIPVDNKVIMPYSQPFFGNTTGEKYFFYQLLNDSTAFGYKIGSIDQVKISIVDPISGNSTTTINNINNQGSNSSFIETYTKFNGFTATSITVTISGNPEEMYSSGQAIYEYVKDIQVGEIVPTAQNPALKYQDVFIKPISAYGTNSYTTMKIVDDCTYINGNYYANIPMKRLHHVESNHLIPPSYYNQPISDNPNITDPNQPTNDLSYWGWSGSNMCLRDIAWSPLYNRFVVVGDFIDRFQGLYVVWAFTDDGVYYVIGGGSISGPEHARSFSSVCWSSGLNQFCAGTSNYRWVDGVGTQTGGTGYIYSSAGTSGSVMHWVAHPSTMVETSSIVWSDSLNLYAAVGHNQITNQNRIVTSPDGINWTDRASYPLAYNARICWSEPLSLFCISTGVISVSGYQVITSSDGITWTQRYQAAQPLGFTDITWSTELGIFVMIASNANYSVAISTNGIDWNIVNTPSIVAPTQVIWVKEFGLFYMFSYSGTYISPNGTNWTLANPNTNQITRAAWSPKLGKMLGVNHGSVVYTI
jgi:hypothetical protein